MRLLTGSFFNRHAIVQDLRPRLSLLVNTRFQVLFHSASRRSFHLSLTVLVHYRSESIFSLMTWSSQIHTGLHVSCDTWGIAHGNLNFAYKAFTYFGYTFQNIQLFLLLTTGAPQPSNSPLRDYRSLGFSLFARRYLGNLV
jgi:hypothetical protein